MRILMVAPHPYYQERGTPIAVDLLLQSLSEQGHEIDLVTFNEGEQRNYNNVTLHRIKSFPEIKGIKPGFSFKKLYLDVWLFFKAFLLIKNMRHDVIHAVEESGFMALVYKWVLKVPFVLDMDSLMTTQLVNKYSSLKFFEGILRFIESIPIRQAMVVVPVCAAIADEVGRHRKKNVFLLNDVSMVSSKAKCSVEDLKIVYKIKTPVFMYIGNLETYQGIDLLIESYAMFKNAGGKGVLIIIGGSDDDISGYRKKVNDLRLSDSIYFAGRKPVASISGYMKQSDVLISPRISGENTPMKIYSYLDSGVVVLATDIPTHTQVMNSDISVLAEPNPKAFSTAMLRIISDQKTRKQLANRAGSFIEKEHSLKAFKSNLKSIYKVVEQYNG